MSEPVPRRRAGMADRLVFVVVAVFAFALDRATKVLVEQSIQRGDRIDLAFGVLELRHARNSGIAFGLFSGAGWVLVALTVIVFVVLMATLLRVGPSDRVSIVGGALLVGGAAGNVVDRIQQGYVVDFLHLPNWPTFNVADIAIVVGVALLVVQQWRLAAMEQRAAREQRDGPAAREDGAREGRSGADRG